MRYCKQRDKYSCGAIALLNIDKFFGRQITYQDLPKYKELVDCQPISGTQISNISKVIGRASRRTWRSSKQFLNDGNCVMILWDGVDTAHYFIMGMGMCQQRKVFFIVNRYRPDVGVSATYIAPPQRAAIFLRNSVRTWYVDKETGLL
jgi:hypothetical protein